MLCISRIWTVVHEGNKLHLHYINFGVALLTLGMLTDGFDTARFIYTTKNIFDFFYVHFSTASLKYKEAELQF